MSAEQPVTRGPEVVLHAEQLDIGTRSEAVRARVRRRIVTETQHLEVTTRREVLEVEYLPAPDEARAAAATPVPGPIVMVLSEEVPVVQLVTRPYEQVTVEVHGVEEQQQVTERVATERVDITTT